MSTPVLVARELLAEETLSQYGYRTDVPPFRRTPREWREEPGMSLILGDPSPAAAMSLVRFRKSCFPDDGVRRTTVGKLLAAGFVVVHSPNPRNPGHVTVSYPQPWGEDTAEMFDSCFDEPIYADGGDNE